MPGESRRSLVTKLAAGSLALAGRPDVHPDMSVHSLHRAPLASHEAHLSMHLAEAYAVMGAIDEALDALDNATRRGFVHYPYIALHNRLFENIRSDQRFKELMVRVKRDWESFGQLDAGADG